jgi:nitroreductase
MDALEAITERMSPLELGEPAPDEAALRRLIEAALRAPDHGRLRPWRFLIVRGEGRKKLGEVLALALKRRDPQASPDLLERERQKPLRAPLILIVAARITPNPKIPAVEQLLSAGAAAQNIMIACHALRFGAMWKTGEPAYDASVKRALGLRVTDEIAGFLYIGTPKSMPIPQPPLNVADFAESWPPVQDLAPGAPTKSSSSLR